MKRRKKILKYAFFIIYYAAVSGCALLYYAGAGYCAEVVDKIVAVVNDDIITQSELEESMHAFVADYQLRYGPEETADRLGEAKSDALNRLIEEKLLLQEAKRRNIQVSAAEIDERLLEIKSKFASEGEFEEALSKTGLSVEKLKDRYRGQLMVRTLVNGIVSYNVRITPTQIAAHYYGHKNDFIQPESVKFRIILLKFKPEQEKDMVSSRAEGLLRRIRSGEDFIILAKQHSEGPNAVEGGEMDFVFRGEMTEEIDDAIFSLNEGEVSEVVESPLGCNIVKVEKKIPQSEMSLEETTPIIKKRLFEREAELIFREFISKLKKNAYIDIKR